MDVHIVAAEMRCALGLTADSAAAAIRAGLSRVAEHPTLMDGHGEKVLCARDPTIEPSVPVAGRIVRLVEDCIGEIAAQLSLPEGWANDVPVLVALPEARPGFDRQAAGTVHQSLAASRILGGTRGVRIELIGEGHAGALLALQLATARVTSGRDQLVVVGGADSYLDAPTIEWLDRHRRLARANVRGGFSPGEGAAFVAVATMETCARLGWDSMARIRGIACAQERRDPMSDAGLLGEALTEAVLAATSDLTAPRELITDIYGDINGERVRTADWGYTVLRTSALFRDPTDYVSTAGQCGDVGAATAGFGCVLATAAWKCDRASGSRALVWAGSWNGLRGVAVLERPTGDA
jgi:3-oxoacyl-[acyl-carrier-protein] synthase-1